MEASREDVRLFAIFLDDYHVRRRHQHGGRATALAQFVETQLGPSDMIGVMYPLESTSSVRMTRNHSAVDPRAAAVHGRRIRVRAEESVRGKLRALPDRNRRAHPQPGVAVGASKSLDRSHGIAQGRAQGARSSSARATRTCRRRRCATPTRTMPGLGNPNARNPSAGDNDLNEDRAAVARVDGHGLRSPRGLRQRQPQQRGDLRRRPARPARLRVRHQRKRRPSDRLEAPHLHDGHAADAGRSRPTAGRSSTATTSRSG